MTDFSEQINRIKKKLVQAKNTDKDYKVFGASSHKYQINQPATINEIKAFESKYAVQLPEYYRAFILHIGNGGPGYQNSGAGPFYGIYPLGEHLEELVSGNPKAFLTTNCCLHPEMNDVEWENLTPFLNDDNITDENYYQEIEKIYSGILPLGSQGCSYLHALVLNGQHKGKVINLEMAAEQKPRFAFENNFLDWYERWLDEIISGHLIKASTSWFGYAKKN